MSSKDVIAAAGAVTAIFNIAAGGACGYALPGNVIQLDCAAGGLNIDPADGDIFQRDWGRHAADPHIRLGHTMDGNLPGFRRKTDIAAEAFSRNGRRSGAYIHGDAGRDSNVIVDAGLIGGGLLAGKSVGAELNALFIRAG